MGKALYRTYRSKSLSEVVGQEHITTTLQKALDTGKISHAYLFTGPRGVGKTSIARILAHELNNLPYDDATHMDIIEIDAASNRRIDEIRELRDKVYVAPTSAKYKVYIIDEVHMLTREAFNALLKTLEEPPAHVVFILATTDAHKVPETIVSRTQRFSFKPIEPAKVIAHLRQIAKKEGIKVDDEALELLAAHGEGSFRDSISMLDQARSTSDSITLSDVQSLLGIPPEQSVEQLLDLIGESASPKEVMGAITELYGQGYQAQAVAKQLAEKLRIGLVENTGTLSHEQSLSLLQALLEVPTAFQPERFLELCLLNSLQPSIPKATYSVKAAKDSSAARTMTREIRKSEPIEESAKDASAAPKTPAKLTEEPSKSTDSVEPTQDTSIKNVEPASDKESAATPNAERTGPVDSTSWPQVLNVLKKTHNTLYGVVRMAQPDFSQEGTLRLKFRFAFHQKRMKEAKNNQLVSNIIKEVTGQSVQLESVVDTMAPATPMAEVKTSDIKAIPNDSASLSTISNIFGGGELLK